MKDDLKQIFRRAARLSYKPLLLLCAASAITAILALRQNNQTMIDLRNKLYAADQAGGDVEMALNDLREHVYGHMNTDLSSGGNAIKPPIQLKYTYERLLADAQAKANNSQLYTEAANYCQARIPASVSGRARVPCVEEYIMSHGGKPPQPIPVGLYQFDFVSPVWSPDLAGWSLVATSLLGVAAVVQFVRQRFF